MASNTTSFTATLTETGVVFDICSEDINIVIASGTGSRIFYITDKSTPAQIVVNESPSSVALASASLITLTNTENTTTFYLNPDKIINIISFGSGSKVYFNVSEGKDLIYTVNETPSVISGLINVALGSFSFTIGVAGVTGCDYNFTSVANTTQQSIQLGGTTIIPASTVVASIVEQCVVALVGGTATSNVGLTSGAGDFISSFSLSSLNAITSVSAQVAASASASSVYFSITPSANWNTLSAGKWTVKIKI